MYAVMFVTYYDEWRSPYMFYFSILFLLFQSEIMINRITKNIITPIFMATITITCINIKKIFFSLFNYNV
jgi:hypothetical protein